MPVVVCAEDGRDARPQFIDKVVDDPVPMQTQVSQSELYRVSVSVQRQSDESQLCN